ncbi:polysaccharide deacetylase family protein, partial [Xenorhabdus griffiniae]
MNRKILNWLESVLMNHYGERFLLNYVNGFIYLTIPKCEKKSIVFSNTENNFYKLGKSELNCNYWSPESEGLQSVLGHPLPILSNLPIPNNLIEYNIHSLKVKYDLLGMIYWILSRSEEVNRDNELDIYGRFPAIASHAYNNGYLNRPIVDEWLYILRQLIYKLWPKLPLREHKFEIKATHDVDRPFRFKFSDNKTFFKKIAGDIIKHKRASSLIYAPLIKLASSDFFLKRDPYNSFDWIMDISEKENIKSEFYFICDITDQEKDADYNIESPLIKELIKKIHKRGHIIGLHPSFNSYLSESQIKSEFNKLLKLLSNEKIKQKKYGGRMHYLRWSHPKTLMSWEEAGLNYDSTLGYADLPGFRCGTCFEYPAINPITHESLKLRIRPLIVMECSILSSKYMGVNLEKAEEIFNYYKKTCQKVNGIFTLLWHNSE